jgi:hypothetical protein
MKAELLVWRTLRLGWDSDAATRLYLLSQLTLSFVGDSFPSSRHRLEHLLCLWLVSRDSQLAALLCELPVLCNEFHLTPDFFGPLLLNPPAHRLFHYAAVAPLPAALVSWRTHPAS